jgi:hypothetical protein
MADSRRWDTRSGRRRDDEFTRAPSFRDGQDSDPLSPDNAAWYGAPHHRVSFGVGFAILAGIAAVAFMALAPGGSPDLSSGASAAQSPNDGFQAPDQGNLTAVIPGVSVSGTPTGLPLPTPTVPSLP